MEIKGKASYFSYSCSSDVLCKKHPSPSSVGVCPECLKDRLIKLVCSDCGEPRLSSCSCSSGLSSSYRNSSCSLDVGSVGRISFLIENDKSYQSSLLPHKTLQKAGLEESMLLKRSSSCCIEAKKSRGLWKLGKLFGKKREKETGTWDQKREIKPLCSFRATIEGSFYHNPDQKLADFSHSSAKVSDYNEHPSAGLGKGLLEDETITANKSVMSDEESDLNEMDALGFIDLDLGHSSDSRKGPSSHPERAENGFSSGSTGSCRIAVSEARIKKWYKGGQILKWIFRHPSSWRSGGRSDAAAQILGESSLSR